MLLIHLHHLFLCFTYVELTINPASLAAAAAADENMTASNNNDQASSACGLCGCQQLLFEPTVLYCSGDECAQKIRRNATYYSDRSKQNVWCTKYYNTKLGADEALVLDDGTETTKQQLQSHKNDDVPEEAWARCDDCNAWYHQICALFNSRKLSSTKATFSCPKCVIRKRIEYRTEPVENKQTAKNLPTCQLSDAIEAGLERCLTELYEQTAKEQGLASIDDVEKVDGLTVRVVSHLDKKHRVRDNLYEHYSRLGCPVDYPVRTKCISLFQTIHGVDVFLFAMFVYEYGHDCPAPNRRRVYISYIDSVQYFQPKEYRSAVFQAILVEYLRFVKERGFHTAHIWSCPPAPGDEYIFYNHPSKQQIPEEEMLRQWYYSVLDKAQKEGIVVERTDLHEEYFKNHGANAPTGSAPDPTSLPYFEGDYLPGEIENIIQELKEEVQRGTITDPFKVHNRPPGAKVGTRSNPGGQLLNQLQDKVMLRLGNKILPMKENFMIARLRSKRFVAAVERGEDVSQWRDDDADSLNIPEIVGKDSSVLHQRDTDLEGMEEEVVSEVPMEVSEEAKANDASIVPGDESKDETLSMYKGVFDSLGYLAVVAESKDEVMTDAPLVEDRGQALSSLSMYSQVFEFLKYKKATNVVDQAPEEGTAETPAPPDKMEVEETTEEASAQRPETAANDGETSPMEVDEPMTEMTKKTAQKIRDTFDPDDIVENEILENRQAFLNYCQGNRFQFDELRRAKHSSVMTLFQLHNPMAPKFLQSCGCCYHEIACGDRYHCNDCPNFDLCEDCYQPLVSGVWKRRGSRYSHDPSHTFIRLSTEMDEEKLKSQEERAKQLKTHLELLKHVAACMETSDSACGLKNCQKLKEFFEHVQQCSVTYRQGCKICTRMLSLVALHSRACVKRSGHCPLPFCDSMRERQERLRRQQQLMDDRRRQAQNERYRQTEN